MGYTLKMQVSGFGVEWGEQFAMALAVWIQTYLLAESVDNLYPLKKKDPNYFPVLKFVEKRCIDIKGASKN